MNQLGDPSREPDGIARSHPRVPHLRNERRRSPGRRVDDAHERQCVRYTGGNRLSLIASKHGELVAEPDIISLTEIEKHHLARTHQHLGNLEPDYGTDEFDVDGRRSRGRVKLVLVHGYDLITRGEVSKRAHHTRPRAVGPQPFHTQDCPRGHHATEADFLAAPPNGLEQISDLGSEPSEPDHHLAESARRRRQVEIERILLEQSDGYPCRPRFRHGKEQGRPTEVARRNDR